MVFNYTCQNPFIVIYILNVFMKYNFGRLFSPYFMFTSLWEVHFSDFEGNFFTMWRKIWESAPTKKEGVLMGHLVWTPSLSRYPLNVVQFDKGFSHNLSSISCTEYKNATESHSAGHATHTEWHKRTGNFEMRSGSERMHTWRRTPSTGRNFHTLIIWITVS